VKLELKDYQGALIDLDIINYLKPNEVTILNVQGDVKWRSKDYQGTILDLNNTNDRDPKNEWALMV
jgi:hypothetical protein